MQRYILPKNIETDFVSSSSLSDVSPSFKKYKYRNNINNKFFSFDYSIHAAIAEINRITDRYGIQPSLNKDLLEKNWVSKGYKTYQEENEFFNRGIMMLTNYCNYPQDQGIDSLLINKFLTKKVDKNLILCARIDKLYETQQGKFEVVDYKTGKVISYSNNFELDLRTAAYVILIKEALNISTDSVSYYYLHYNKKFVRKFSKQDIDTCYPLISKTIDNLKA